MLLTFLMIVLGLILLIWGIAGLIQDYSLKAKQKLFSYNKVYKKQEKKHS